VSTKILTNGDDTYTNSAKYDVVDALSGNDKVYGVNHAETIYGRKGYDIIEGGGKNDKLYGNEHSDELWGDNGNDTLAGGSDYDYLYGGGGKDVVNGGSSGDTIYGGIDADKLTGGTGGDGFVFYNSDAKRGAGEDVITDFKSGLDYIDLSNTDTTYQGTQTFTPDVGKWSFVNDGDWYVTWHTASGYHDVNLGNDSVAFEDIWY
jgi:Ca2+-binding RTX toxin-like protein